MNTDSRIITPADRAAWLAERRNGIGASEAAAALGLSPYETPLQLYLRKTGELPEPEETEAMRWGTALEPLIAEEYERRTGRRISQRQVFLRWPGDAPLFATLDAIDEANCPVEFKTTNSFKGRELGEEESDQLPDHWLIQAHIQMLLHDSGRAWFAVLIGGQRFRLFTVDRDGQLLGHIFPKLQAFWSRVERRDPPPPSLPADLDTLKALHPGCEGEVELDPWAVAMVEQYQVLGKLLKDMQQDRDTCKGQLLAALGDRRDGVLPDGRRVRRHVIEHAEQQITRKAYREVRLTFPKEGR